MSSTAYGFVTINDHGDLSGNGQLTISAAVHTGRNSRTKDFNLEAEHGGQAYLEVVQMGEPILEIDHFEDDNGNTVRTISGAGGLYYMCGYANVDSLVAAEGAGTSQTDLNNQTTGRAWTNGYTIVESNGTVHTGVMFSDTISYGTDARYKFKIPVLFTKSNTMLEIIFFIKHNEQESVFAIRQLDTY